MVGVWCLVFGVLGFGVWGCVLKFRHLAHALRDGVPEQLGEAGCVLLDLKQKGFEVIWFRIVVLWATILLPILGSARSVFDLTIRNASPCFISSSTPGWGVGFAVQVWSIGFSF